MRINLGKCKSLDEFQTRLRDLDRAADLKQVVVKIYREAIETGEALPGQLRGRTEIKDARASLLRNNPLFAERFIPVNIKTQPPLGQTAESLSKKLKETPSSISIKTRDGKILKAPRAVLPPFFSAGKRDEKKPTPLDFDSETVNLFLDYQCGIPIDKQIPLHQLMELHRLADFLIVESLYDTTLALLIDSINGENRHIILPELLSIMLTQDETAVIPVTNCFYKQIVRALPETKSALFKQLKSAADKDNKDYAALYHLGIFCLHGFGTTQHRDTGMEYIERAAVNHYPPAVFFFKEDAKSPNFFYFSQDSKLYLNPDSPRFLYQMETFANSIAKFPLLAHVEKISNDIPKFYALLSKCTPRERGGVREYFENIGPHNQGKYRTALFHMAIFYQEGLGGARDNEAAFRIMETLARDPYDDTFAQDYCLNQYPKNKTILESYNIELDLGLLPSIPLENLFQALISPNPPLNAARDFFRTLKAAPRSVQKQYRKNLEDMAKSYDPVAKYHLARCYREGIGGPKNERRGLELLKESAEGLYEPAAEDLATRNPNIAQKSDADIQVSLRRLRESPEDTISITLEGEGLEEETLQVPRAFLPPYFNQERLKGVKGETKRLFVDFQYGLGIPANTSFERLVELNQLAYNCESKDLLKVTTDLITKSFASRSPDELLPQLFDLVLLEEKPFLYTSSVVPLFLEQLAKAGKKTQKAFIAHSRPFVVGQKAAAENLLGYCLEHGYGIEKNGEYARNYYQRAANSNNILARYNLAHLWPDPKQALIFFKQAADQGLPDAQYDLGLRLMEDSGEMKTAEGIKKAEEGFAYLSKAADQGNAEAQYCVARAFYRGYPVPSSVVLALEFFKLAAVQGHSKAIYMLGQFSTNPQIAFEWYLEGAELGDLDSIFELANCYARGEGVAQNAEQAFLHYKTAADRGHSVAQYKVGLAYQNAPGKDLEAALKYLTKAADAGHRESQELCGKYYSGIGGPKRPALAFKYFKLAADKGSNYAQEQVGICYEDGVGVAKAPKLAFKYYEMLYNALLEAGPEHRHNSDGPFALKDFPRAANFLGQCYDTGFTKEDGSVVAPNPHRAFRCFVDAANKGIASAANEAGKYYEYKGPGLTCDVSKATHYYQLALSMGADFFEAHYFLGLHERDSVEALSHMEEAAKFHNAKAEYELGKWYEEGSHIAHHPIPVCIQTEKKPALAVEYYERAAEHGSPEANLRIGVMYLNGEFNKKKSEAQALYYIQKAAALGNAQANDLLTSRNWSK